MIFAAFALPGRRNIDRQPCGRFKRVAFFPEVACNVPFLRLEVLAPNMGPYRRPFRGILGTLKGTYGVCSWSLRIPWLGAYTRSPWFQP